MNASFCGYVKSFLMNVLYEFYFTTLPVSAYVHEYCSLNEKKLKNKEKKGVQKGSVHPFKMQEKPSNRTDIIWANVH